MPTAVKKGLRRSAPPSLAAPTTMERALQVPGRLFFSGRIQSVSPRAWQCSEVHSPWREGSVRRDALSFPVRDLGDDALFQQRRRLSVTSWCAPRIDYVL